MQLSLIHVKLTSYLLGGLRISITLRLLIVIFL